MTFTPDGKGLVIAGEDKTVRLINADNGAEIRKFEGPEYSVYSIAVSKDGKRIAGAGVGLGESRKVFVWDIGTSAPSQTLLGHKDDVYRVSFNEQGNRLLSIGYAGTLNVWDLGSQKSAFQSKLPAIAYAGSYSSDGSRVAVSTDDGKKYLIEIPQSAR